MTRSDPATVLDLAAGAVLLVAALVVWRRQQAALLRLLVVQGAALAVIPITRGLHAHDTALVLVGWAVLGLRAGLLPWVAGRALARDASARDTRPLVNTTASLLVVAVLTILAYAVARPVVHLAPSAATNAAPAALAVVLIGVFVVVSRGRALAQIVGLIVVDNGIAAFAFLTTDGVPLIVELGASIDVLLAVLILRVLAGRLRVTFGGTDLDELRELRD